MHLDEKTKEQEKQRKKMLKKKGLLKEADANNEDGIVDPQQVELKIEASSQDHLLFDGQKVDKTDIANLINSELKRFMDQKLDRIKDSVPALIGRFEQNENAIKDHNTI